MLFKLNRVIFNLKPVPCFSEALEMFLSTNGTVCDNGVIRWGLYFNFVWNLDLDHTTSASFTRFSHDKSCTCVIHSHLRVHAMGPCTVLRSAFIASISDAVSSHPVSPRLCTETEKYWVFEEWEDHWKHVLLLNSYSPWPCRLYNYVSFNSNESLISRFVWMEYPKYCRSKRQ